MLTLDQRPPHTHPLLRGLAAGDRNGGPIRLALLLCGAMEGGEHFNSDRIFSAYRAWFDEGEAYDTGGTLASVVRYVRAECPRAEAVRAAYAEYPSEGVAPAHRAAPLALWLRGEALDRALCAEASLSHHSLVSARISMAVGRLCAALIDGAPLDEALDGLGELELPSWLEFESLKSTSVHVLSRGGHAPDVLRSALWFLIHTRSLTEAIEASISFAGPENYCPVLVGSIGGCLHREVPQELLEHPQVPAVFAQR